MIENKRFGLNCKLGLVNGEEPLCKCLLDNGKHKSYREWVDLLNNLSDENEELKKVNEQLKQQLLCDSEGVCDICNHEYLIPSSKYFIAKCLKGHEECSKEDIKYCEDFELRGSKFRRGYIDIKPQRIKR